MFLSYILFEVLNIEHSNPVAEKCLIYFGAPLPGKSFNTPFWFSIQLINPHQIHLDILHQPYLSSQNPPPPLHHYPDLHPPQHFAHTKC